MTKLLLPRLCFTRKYRGSEVTRNLSKDLSSDNAIQILEKESLARVWSRLTPADIETFELHLRLDPPQKISSLAGLD